MSNGSWTFATWFKRATRTNDDFIFYIGSADGFSGGVDELQLYLPANSDTLRLLHYTVTNSNDVNLSSAVAAPTNQWHHAAVTFEKTADNTGTVRLYLNGALAGTKTNLTWVLRQDLAVVLGGHTSTSTAVSSRWFNGSLDDAALFRGELTADEIASVAQQSVVTFSGTGVSGNVAFAVSNAPPSPPQLSAALISGGAFQFQVVGQADYNYTVQASTNLVTWTNLFTTNPSAMPFIWSDSAQTNFPRRFYRVVLGP
jgi:hypothetical protein